MRLHIDIETYSSVDLGECGVYAYVESPDFQILLLSYSYDGQPIITLDLASELGGTDIPDSLKRDIYDPNITNVAHNANFERICLSKYFGKPIPIRNWECTMVKAAYCGLPLNLDELSDILNLTNKKDKAGKALITFFSKPNKKGLRNLPDDNPKKWAAYCAYNKRDVEAEVELDDKLSVFEWHFEEPTNYYIDQRINDTGINLDPVLAENALQIDRQVKAELSDRMKKLTGLSNPNSDTQIKRWIKETTGIEVESLDKKVINDIKKAASGSPAEGVLELRSELKKTSTAKYGSALSGRSKDGRVRGLFQFYGAYRTGRFAGRRVQLQNLPKNFLEPIGLARQLLIEGDRYGIEGFFPVLSYVLSQMLRTMFIPAEGNLFAVADFSAIEARVTAWLADEKWRLEVFATTGKIYEASAEMMFHLPKGSVGKHSPERQRGKVAELALGYGGTTEALKIMDLEKALKEDELPGIVSAWREASHNIVLLWRDLERCAKNAVRRGGVWTSKFKGISFKVEDKWLTMKLPNGRKLYYFDPKIGLNRFDGDSLTYMGPHPKTGRWTRLDTWGGKLTENCVQAISRDALCLAMLKIENAGLPIVLHVHDEVCVDVPADKAEASLQKMLDIMAEPIPWAEGLLLKGDGFITEYYKKD